MRISGVSARRSANWGMFPGVSRSFSPDMSLEMFRRMCLIRYFELKVAEAYKAGIIRSPIYLSIGQEAIAAAVSTVISGYHIFAQHRAHGVYLAFGGDPIRLIDELLGRPTGCTGGKGGSPMIQDPDIGMIGYNGLIGENVPRGVGYALGSGHKTVCFFGDAAAEEDYVFSAIGFAATHKLPVLFICEDNDLAVLTRTYVRRSWEVADVVGALGIPTVDITDDPWLIAHHAKGHGTNLPAFINCRTCRNCWHTGVGVDGPPEWDRLTLVKQELERLGIEAGRVEEETGQNVEKLWERQLPKQ